MPLSPRSLTRVGYVLILSSTLSFADTIVLKSGEKFQGRVISETVASLDAEIQITPSITDVRTFQKSDIEEIVKTDPSVTAYAAIKGIKLGPNSMAASDYETIIYGKLKPFVDNYPASEHAGSVKKTLDAFIAERDRVKVGELKLNHQWFTASQIAQDRYNVIAAVLLAQMQAFAAQGDFISALNQFTTLEKTYPGSKVFPEAVEYAKKLIPGVRKTIENRTLVYKRDIAEREEGIAITADHKKPELLAAVKAEEKQVGETLDAAKNAGIVWTPIYPRSKRSLDDLSKTVDSEATRLAQMKTGDMLASIQESIEGRTLLKSGDLKSAEKQFAAASTHWPANEMIKQNTALLAAAQEAAKPTPTPSPSASPVASAPQKPAAKTPAAQTPAAAIPEATPATPVVSAIPVASVAPKPLRTPLPLPPEPEPAFFTTLQGAITIFTILAAGAVGITVFLRSRAKTKVVNHESNHDHASV